MPVSLIRELMIYEFELLYNTTKATRNICCVKGECSVYHGLETKYFILFALQESWS